MLRVWTPPGYSKENAPPGGWPILYMNDGQNMFEDWIAHQVSLDCGLQNVQFVGVSTLQGPPPGLQKARQVPAEGLRAVCLILLIFAHPSVLSELRKPFLGWFERAWSQNGRVFAGGRHLF